jgi:hypothetical protein
VFFFVPLIVHICEEDRLPAFEITLDDSAMADLISSVNDFVILEENVGLKLEPAWASAGDDDLSDLQHRLIDC